MLTIQQVECHALERYRFERLLMGTRFVLVCYAKDQASANRAADEAFEVAERLNTIASDYLPKSEISRLSTHLPNTVIPVSTTLYSLLDKAREVAELTHGAFDPTLGPLTKLWRQSRATKRLPASFEISEAKEKTGWRYFTLSTEDMSITLHKSNMQFDLGGIAKGYVVDLMYESLVAKGIDRVMIAAGGDIRLGNPPPGRTGWKVGIQTFDLESYEEVRVLSNVAVSTSGDLYQSIEIGGERYSHIVSPWTGVGLTKRIAAVVIAKEGKLSDPIATAACVAGFEAMQKFRAIPGVLELKITLP